MGLEKLQTITPPRRWEYVLQTALMWKKKVLLTFPPMESVIISTISRMAVITFLVTAMSGNPW